MNITCHYIMTGDGQYLTDHHNRDNEFLIGATPSPDREDLAENFWESFAAHSSDLDEEDYTDDDIRQAIRAMVSELTDADCDPVNNDPDCYSEEVMVWAYLSWDPSPQTAGW